jgi:hypothetical protein
MEKREKFTYHRLSLYSACPRFPPTCPIYTYQPTPFMIYRIRDPIIHLLDPCALQPIRNPPPIPLTQWMCRSTTISTEMTWIKPPLSTTANLLDAIQAKLNLCHYRLPQRFLYRIRSSYNRLLGLPQQGCKCFWSFGLRSVRGDCGFCGSLWTELGHSITVEAIPALRMAQDQDGFCLPFPSPKPDLIVPSSPTLDLITYPQIVADNQKQWKDIRAKYTEAVEE